jgi:hypothetical protein
MEPRHPEPKEPLFFFLQGLIVFLNERPYLVCHAQELFPLFPIECDRKASEPIN